ncbi:MAG: hypothetical protein BMS9Abin30_0766 [Gammaproteobacteria bacterium]|nr:MAG: hypothetical protein BMS9Abin30_0766 [Gammaproteobacteria bacterium]
MVSAAIKGKASRAALLRIAGLLTVVLTLSVVLEYRQSQNLISVSGKVVKVEEVNPGRSGDSREFRIEYFVYAEKYTLVTRRGILDSLGAFCCLAIGDSVPIAVDREDPLRAILDSTSARYPYTLSFGLLTLIYLISVLVIAAKARMR